MISGTRPLIPQADPRASYVERRGEIGAAVLGVLERGEYILGPEVAAFETEFAGYLCSKYAVALASGTDALVLAMRAIGVGPGDEVLTVSHTAVATVAAIELAGAVPVLVDIEPRSFNLDAELADETLRRRKGRIKAIIAVHLYGRPADLPALLAVANRHGVDLIEDCAQSHGASLQGRFTGTWGRIAAFSFYPTKNLGAFGDGGAVVTSDGLLADRVRLLREYGWRERISEISGMNSRLDSLQAAILRVKLRHLDEDNRCRRQIAHAYDQGLAGTNDLGLPEAGTGVHVYHQYVVRCQQREPFRKALASSSVGTGVHYPVPVHLMPAYRDRLPIGIGGLMRTESAARDVVSLPMFPQLGMAQVEAVCRAITGRPVSRRLL